MAKVKEFYAEMYLDEKINKWLEEHPGIDIIYLGYAIHDPFSGCLILYEE